MFTNVQPTVSLVCLLGVTYCTSINISVHRNKFSLHCQSCSECSKIHLQDRFVIQTMYL